MHPSRMKDPLARKSCNVVWQALQTRLFCRRALDDKIECTLWSRTIRTHLHSFLRSSHTCIYLHHCSGGDRTAIYQRLTGAVFPRRCIHLRPSKHDLAWTSSTLFLLDLYNANFCSSIHYSGHIRGNAGPIHDGSTSRWHRSLRLLTTLIGKFPLKVRFQRCNRVHGERRHLWMCRSCVEVDCFPFVKEAFRTQVVDLADWDYYGD